MATISAATKAMLNATVDAAQVAMYATFDPVSDLTWHFPSAVHDIVNPVPGHPFSL